MANLRCFNHANREASARCPECRKYFCKECTTEHQLRILCASCLKRLTKKRASTSGVFAYITRTFIALFATFVIYFFFVLVGQIFYDTAPALAQPTAEDQ
jgi:hypothetical protein